MRAPWFNLGDWSEARDYPAACEALARRLAARADLAVGQRALDLGAGGCAQTALWIEAHGLSHVDALEPDPAAREAARAWLRERGLEDRVELHDGDAADLSRFEDARFDRALSLDAAYHFSSRDRFLAEAARVLKPGGRLAVMDLALERAPGARERAGARLAGVPRANLWRVEELAPALARAGFVEVEVEVWPEVVAGFARYGPRSLAAFRARDWPKVLATAWGQRLVKAPIVAVAYFGCAPPRAT